MRAFVSVFALFVVAFAKPQYNYESGPIGVPQLPFNQVVNTPQYTQQVSTGPLITTGQISTPQIITQQFPSTPVTTQQFQSVPVTSQQFPSVPITTQQFQSAPVTTQQFQSAPVTQHISTPQQISTGFQPIATPQFQTPQVGGVYHEEPVQRTHEAPLITKQFFLHSAPEDHSAIQRTKHFVLGRPQKNYRVVFIKNPSDTNANVHLSAEYAPQEEKTVIYVLSQKDTALDIDNIATPAPTQPSKPEVFFIKYKTPEEAAHAQREIQNQYNVLGGSTSVEDGGLAPVTSVVGSLDRPVDNHALNTLGNEYLPVKKA